MDNRPDNQEEKRAKFVRPVPSCYPLGHHHAVVALDPRLHAG